MTSRIFVDTNIVIYSIDERDLGKHRKARDLMDSFSSSAPAVISTQVMQEMYSALTRKLGISPPEARAMVALTRRRCSVQIITAERVMEAIDISVLNTISLWDALLIVCASAANCDELWTEDLNPGQSINGVRIVNPFA